MTERRRNRPNQDRTKQNNMSNDEILKLLLDKVTKIESGINSKNAGNLKQYKSKSARLAKPMSGIKNPFGFHQIAQYAINKTIAIHGSDLTKNEILEKIWQSASESILDLPNWYKSGKTVKSETEKQNNLKKLF